MMMHSAHLSANVRHYHILQLTAVSHIDRTKLAKICRQIRLVFLGVRIPADLLLEFIVIKRYTHAALALVKIQVRNILETIQRISSVQSLLASPRRIPLRITSLRHRSHRVNIHPHYVSSLKLPHSRIMLDLCHFNLLIQSTYISCAHTRTHPLLSDEHRPSRR